MNWHEQGNMKAAMEELIRGQEQATRLQSMLKDMLPPENPSGPAADLLIEVLSSFSKALSLLDLGSSAEANPPSSNGGVRRKMQSPRRVSCRGRYTSSSTIINKASHACRWLEGNTMIVVFKCSSCDNFDVVVMHSKMILLPNSIFSKLTKRRKISFLI